MLLGCTGCNAIPDGCDECAGQSKRPGYFAVCRCPVVEASDAFPDIRIIRMAERGILPVGGGTLDQSNAFIEAWEFIESEERMIRNA